MKQVQDEIDAESLRRPVSILGVNEAGHESANALVTDLADLPWLQDTAATDVWSAWGVTWRDVVILDRRNVPRAVYNLTNNNLAESAKRDELKALLRQAAAR